MSRGLSIEQLRAEMQAASHDLGHNGAALRAAERTIDDVLGRIAKLQANQPTDPEAALAAVADWEEGTPPAAVDAPVSARQALLAELRAAERLRDNARVARPFLERRLQAAQTAYGAALSDERREEQARIVTEEYVPALLQLARAQGKLADLVNDIRLEAGFCSLPIVSGLAEFVDVRLVPNGAVDSVLRQLRQQFGPKIVPDDVVELRPRKEPTEPRDRRRPAGKPQVLLGGAPIAAAAAALPRVVERQG